MSYSVDSLFYGLLLAGLLFAARPGQAQPTTITLGPRGGYSLSAQAPFLGGDFRVDEASLPFVYHLGFDYFPETTDPDEAVAPRWQLDVNSYVPFRGYHSVFTLQLGGGFSVQHTLPPGGAETGWGINGVAGFVLNSTGRVQPFVQSRLTLAQETTFDVMGGFAIVLHQ